MIQLDEHLSRSQNTRKIHNLPELVAGADKEFRLRSNGKIQWWWTDGHKKGQWVTWARIVYSNDRSVFIIHWKLRKALWTEQTVGMALSMLHLSQEAWVKQQT